MLHQGSLVAAASAALLLAFSGNVLGLYSGGSPVLKVTAKTYDALIAKSNHTSILEFYAPWCGHCKNLKPAYEKAAKSLAGLAKVAAVDCDEESNKAFCGSMGVQGFPTLKIIRPGKKTGRPIVEEYQGPRSAKAIVEAVVDKIPNHVKRVGDKDLETWLKDGNDTAKAILFSNKGTTGPLLKSLAVDFLGGISFAQIRDKEIAAVELFGIKNFPTLVLLPGGDKDAILYDGALKKEPMLKFLSTIMAPNPDPVPKPQKKPKTQKPGKEESQKEDRQSEEAKATFEQASASHASEEVSQDAASATSVVLEDQSNPTESPDPIVPIPEAAEPQQVLDLPPPIASLDTQDDLQKACLQRSTTTCVLALLPISADSEALLSEPAIVAQASLAQIAHRYAQRRAALFPFYAVPATNEGAAALRMALGLDGAEKTELVAINAKRGWWRRFGDTEYGLENVEGWIDAIRLGEGKKEKLPEDLIADEPAQKGEHDEL